MHSSRSLSRETITASTTFENSDASVTSVQTNIESTNDRRDVYVVIIDLSPLHLSPRETRIILRHYAIDAIEVVAREQIGERRLGQQW